MDRFNKKGVFLQGTYTKQELQEYKNNKIKKRGYYTIVKGEAKAKLGRSNGVVKYTVSEKLMKDLKAKESTTLKELAMLYNEEFSFSSYDTLYSKIIRNDDTFRALKTLNLIEHYVKTRVKDGIESLYVIYTIKREKHSEFMDFYNTYLSSTKIDNYEDVKHMYRNNKKILDSIEELHNKVNKKLKKGKDFNVKAEDIVKNESFMVRTNNITK